MADMAEPSKTTLSPTPMPTMPKEPAPSSTPSEDGFVITDAVDAIPETTPPETAAPPPSAAGGSAEVVTTAAVKAALMTMGFVDEAMLEIVISKHGTDLEACARDLAAASEWDALLDDLSEMGFENRELNRSLMLKHNGNVKRTVKELVEDA